MKVEIDIPESRVQDLLCNAFEGYSNYWYQIVEYIYPYGETKQSLNIQFAHIELPFKNGTIVIKDIEDDGNEPAKRLFYLNLAMIKEGLQIMANKFPVHFANFMQENDDAETGDVFLQCCLFKDVIYG